MQPTDIEYLDYTYNPIKMRCTPVSEGCRGCWHIRMCNRFLGMKLTPELRAAYSGGAPFLDEKELNAPLRLKKPAIIGCQFMGDLFHDDVPTKEIDQVLDVISACPQHIFICLTKRPENIESKLYEVTVENPVRELGGGDYLPNLWIGVSAENQPMFDLRWKFLKQIPAAGYLISYEPALGPLVLPPDFLELGQKTWAVCGGETGPGARPMISDWAYSLRDQCVQANIPFFFKSFGEWIDAGNAEFGKIHNGKIAHIRADGSFWETLPPQNENADFLTMKRVGKKAAGNLLGGNRYQQFPEGMK